MPGEWKGAPHPAMKTTRHKSKEEEEKKMVRKTPSHAEAATKEKHRKIVKHSLAGMRQPFIYIIDLLKRRIETAKQNNNFFRRARKKVYAKANQS